MSHFWCCGCEQHVDEEFDGFAALNGKWYCTLCAEEIKKGETEWDKL